MDSFNFLSVLFSVIMGLALTEVLQGFRALILARRRVAIYWPALLWGGLMILIVAQAWWGMFAMRKIEHWNFVMYGAIVAQITLMYLAAGVSMPDVPERGPVDMRSAYFANRSWFFGLLACAVLTTVFKDYAISGRLTSAANGAFLVLYFILSAIAALTAANWYHRILAPMVLVAIIASAVLLSFQL